MADAKQKWQDAKRQVLDVLDIRVEYELLGVQFASKQPSAKGWLQCRAIGREDSNPSAGVNVSDGPMRGRYKDFGGDGKTIGLWDFAARQGRFGGDWREALKHYARQAGVALPEGAEELAADKFEFFELTFGVMKLYADGKPGVSVRAIQELGGMGARWPKGLPAEKTNHLIAFPMYGSALLDLEPVGWHCVAANPRLKIRKYQGHGHEEALLKTMTVGEYGLMNVAGLNRLRAAKVVNVVEGISDLLAGQSTLDVATYPDHVFVSAGGASYHPKPEWMQHFAGKDVRLWFDVGDADGAGDTGAAVWVASLLPVAAAVRNVKLPLGADGGKNDLRAWLTEPSLPKSYAAMDAYALTFEAVELDDQDAQLSPHAALLKSLGLTVIGEHEGSQKIEVYSDRTRKAGTIHDVDKLTIAKLIQHAGQEVVEEHIHDGREPQPGKFQMKDVKNAIAAAAADKVVGSEDAKLGAGVWEVDDHLLLVKSQEVGILNGHGPALERSHVPFFRSRVLDLSRSLPDWYEPAVMVRYLTAASQDHWCWSVFEEAEALFGKWYWRYPGAPRIIASLVICSWIQTLWEWRPQVAITGASDTGKSLLIEDILKGGIFGPMGLYVLKPTEAAVRQHVRHHAKVIMVDEFEHDTHRQKVLELFRTSSRGGEVIRGTSDQRGVRFGLRHIPWISAIETGLNKQADRNRFIILELAPIPADKRGSIDLPTEDRLRDLGLKLLAIGLRHHKEARRLAALLKARQYSGAPGRVVESFSVPCGMFSAIYGQSVDVAAEFMGQQLSTWDFGSQHSSDQVDLLQEIYTSEVFCEGGQRATVTQLLHSGGNPDYTAALCRVGIKRVHSRVRGDCVFFCPKTIRKTLLKSGGDFAQQDIGQYLMRVEGAQRKKHRLGGNETFNGIEVPCSTLDKIFESDGEDGHQSRDNEQAELT